MNIRDVQKCLFYARRRTTTSSQLDQLHNNLYVCYSLGTMARHKKKRYRSVGIAREPRITEVVVVVMTSQ